MTRLPVREEASGTILGTFQHQPDVRITNIQLFYETVFLKFLKQITFSENIPGLRGDMTFSGPVLENVASYRHFYSS